MADVRSASGPNDRDGNGLVDSSKQYKLAINGGSALPLKNWKGRTYSDASTPHWNAIHAVKHEDGFRVLCEGEGKREGQFSWMSVNADGRINGQSGWQAANDPSTQQWERIFGDVIQKDGVIGKASDDDGNGFLDKHPHYQIYTNGTSVALTAQDGKKLSKRTSGRWNALKAISIDDGFQVLIGSRGRKQQRFRVLDVNLDGQVREKTPWMNGAKALFAGWNTQFRTLLLGKNSRGGVEAASTDGGSPVGELIYTATANDSSNVTYALKDQGQGFDGVLAVDQDSGEVRLNADKLTDIPKDISFILITTDSAGNSSEWPVTVALSLREKTEDNEQDAGAGAAGGISSLSVNPSDESDPEPNDSLGENDGPTSEGEENGPTNVINGPNGDQEEILVSKEEDIVNETSNDDTPTQIAEGTTISEPNPDDPETINEDNPTQIAEGTTISEPNPDDPETINEDNPSPIPEGTTISEPNPDDPETINDEGINNISDVDADPEAETLDILKPSALALHTDSDSGNSQADGVTNINTPTLIGTASANATVELKTEQGVLGTTTADSEGNWSFTVQSGEALDDGTYTISAQTSLEEDSASEPSEILTLTVDTQAPELTSNSTAEAEILVAKGTLDQNNDGLVDGTNQSQILHEGAGIKITRSNGVTKGNSINRRWGYQILKAIPSSKGYELLLKGTGSNHRGKFSIWTTNEEGLITKTLPWTQPGEALRNGWESKFSGDWINGDGVITAFKTNTYFVAPDGNDNNLGTIDQPFKTISWGAQQLREPGDTLNIRGGTYRLAPGKYNSHHYFIRPRKGCRLVGRGQGKGELKCKDYGEMGQKKNLEHSVISLNHRQGTKDHPIRIQSYQGEEVIITGAQKPKNKWVRHEGNIWKTKIYDRPAQLFLDGEMLTGARYPNITKNWHEYDESNSNNKTPGSYWHPDSWIKKGDDLPSIELDGAVLVPLSPDGGAHVSWIDKKAADSNEFTLSPYASGHEPYDHQRGRTGRAIRSSVPEQFFLTSHLNLLDQPGEWHVEMRDKLKPVKTSYGKDYVWEPLHNDLYVWLPDGDDPNNRNIEVRTYNKTYGDPGVEDRLLEITDASHIEVDGLTFKAGDIHLMRTTDTTIQNSKFIHSGHHLHMIGDKHIGSFPIFSNGKSVDTMVNQMGYGGERGKEIYEMDHNLTIKDSEFIATYGGSFLTWGKGVSGNTLENVYFRNKVGGYAAFEIGRNSYNNNINRLEYHTFGWGGIGRIGQGSYEDYEYGKESNYPTSQFELMRIYNPFWHGDDSGVQVNQAQVFNTTFKNNWFHDLPGRNGIRFDGDPSGFGGTVNNNVSFNNRRGFRIKGDYHNVINNIAFQNSNNDVRVSGDKFYGWREGRNCSVSDQMQRNGKWYCALYPNNPNSIRNAGNINSVVHNNAGDKDSYIPVANPIDKTGNSMSKDSRGGRLLIEELRDINNFDFRPKAGSSLIDAGTYIPKFTDGYQGSAPDIGAYEYGDSNYWIPGYQTKKAKTPIPRDGATNAKINTDLIWLEGRDGVSNDIYFGSNPSALQFQGNQSNNIFTPSEPLEAGQTYYWRIDTVTEDKTIPGDLWVFTPVDVDTPKAPGAPILDQGSESGSSNSDGIINTNTPTFSGKGNSGETIQLFQNSNALGTAKVGSDGIWTYTVPQDTPFQDGTYAITAKTSANGISSAVSQSLVITIDTTAPVFTSPEILPAIDENSGTEQVVHQVETTDQTVLTYSIPLENTNDASLFSIDSSTGELRLIPSPNFEKKSKYSIRIEALDLAGNINTQTIDLPINDILETDLNLDGLLDGSGQSKIFLNENVIAIRDQRGEPKGNHQSAKTGYKIIKAVEDGNEFRILTEGTGSDHIGKFRQWRTDQSGNITAQSIWQKPGPAVDLGWEYYFGDVIKKDGFVGNAPVIDANGDGIVDETNQSKIYHEEQAIPIRTKNGTLKGNFKDLKLGYEVIQAAPSESGFALLLKGNGEQNQDKYQKWNTNSDGVITGRSGWKSTDFAVSNGWESQFGDIIKVDGNVGLPPAEDTNDDGLVDGLREPLIFDAGSGIAIKSRSGRIKGHSSNKKTGYTVIKAVSTDQGFAVLSKGQGARTKGMFLRWITDKNGAIIKNSGWKSANFSVADGWEDQFGDLIKPDGIIGIPAATDQNNDGLVDGTNQSQILDDNTGLPITDRRGRVKSNWKNRKWGYNILKAVPEDDGFEVLLKGSGKKNRGRFLIWSTDDSGMITGNTGWKKTPFALKNDWETIFGDIIQPNGVIG